MKSQSDLAPAVLHHIGVLGADETADPADVALVLAVYASKHLEWTERGYVDWPRDSADPSTEDIPDDRFQTLVLLMGNEVLAAFGTPLPEETRIQREQLLLVALRRLVAGVEENHCGERTKKQLGRAVLRRLGVIDPLADPESRDAADVWACYDATYARLSARDLTYWPNGGKDDPVIPNEVFFDLVRIVAEDAAPIFGATLQPEADEGGSMVAPGALGMRNLRRLMGRAPTGLPTRAEYF